MSTNSLPPGLQGSFKEVVVGEHSSVAPGRDWLEFEKTKLFTNVFIWSEDSGKMLLGYKKRGFGKGLYNGFGGKVEPGESVSQAAARELKEESGIEADLAHCGTLLFYSEGYDYAYLIMLYTARPEDCRGEPEETEEMRPEWFSIPEEHCSDSMQIGADRYPPIPLDTMWPDDQFWMPLLLSRKLFAGRVDFAHLGETFGEAKMVKWWFGTAD